MAWLRAPLRKGSHLTLLRGLCDTSHAAETAVVRDLRTGNMERGVMRFTRLRRRPSSALHEAMSAAVAQIPDAGAAQAVLGAMRPPTPSALAHAVHALCRERRVSTALMLLRDARAQGTSLHPAMLAAVSRALHITDFPGREAAARELRDMTAQLKPPHPRVGSVHRFFQPQSLSDTNVWNFAGPHTGNDKSRSFAVMGSIHAAEARLRDAAAERDTDLVDLQWGNVLTDTNIRHEPRLMAAAVRAYVACGENGVVSALNLLVQFVENVKGTSHELCSNRAAYVCTSASKSLAAAARLAPLSALSAYDRLIRADVPGFANAMPITDAYFKILQHASLPLTETLQRIEAAREFHLQFDERTFATALIAILRCASGHPERLVAVKGWLEEIRRAGIPLSPRSYNRFATQLRLESDPELITLLLKDMAVSGVLPSALTYSIIFDSCVPQGRFWSRERVSSLSEGATLAVIDAVAAHMAASRVAHTQASRFSLGRALATAGASSRALAEFTEYMALVEDHATNSWSISDAFDKVLLALSSARCSGISCSTSVFKVYATMRSRSLPVSNVTLAALLQASARLGDENRAVQIASEFAEQNKRLTLSRKALEHLLFALAKLSSAESWESCVALISRSVEDDISPLAQAAVRKLVVGFSKSGCTGACKQVASLFGVAIPRVAQDRNFTDMRSRREAHARDEVSCDKSARETACESSRSSSVLC